MFLAVWELGLLNYSEIRGETERKRYLNFILKREARTML